MSGLTYSKYSIDVAPMDLKLPRMEEVPIETNIRTSNEGPEPIRQSLLAPSESGPAQNNEHWYSAPQLIQNLSAAALILVPVAIAIFTHYYFLNTTRNRSEP
ncbi:hypothetical protein ACTXT7_008004 [Hymenolepis weldensis]